MATETRGAPSIIRSASLVCTRPTVTATLKRAEWQTETRGAHCLLADPTIALSGEQPPPTLSP